MADAEVFLGPSLLDPPVREGLVYLPPARRGDLLAAAGRGVMQIGLVDGLLGGPLTVSPGEVREVARRGVRLWGAASLGALRAVECPEAMIGVGEVYEAFRDGRLSDDDEVVGTFDERYRAISHPLVVLRELLDEAVWRGWIDPPACDAALRELKEHPFDRRTARDLEAVLPTSARREILDLLAAPGRRSVKARDALQLIDAITCPR